MILNSLYKAILVATISSTVLVGCGSDGTNNSSAEDNVLTTVSGTLTDERTALPIANTVVTIGDQQVTTDAEGNYSVELPVTEENVEVVIRADNFIRETQQIDLTDMAGQINAELVPVEGQVSSNVAEEITVQVDNNPAQIVVPPNSLAREDGQPIVGDVTVEIATISPALDSEQMPGNYQTTSGGYIESFGAIIVSALDDSGAELDLQNGATATIQIPVSTRGNVQATMPMFYLDETSNRWVQEGEATLQTNEDGQAYYEANVGRVAVWNADMPMDTVSVSGCVEDEEGNRVEGAHVQADGIDYSALTSGVTNSDGNFTVPVRINSTMYLIGQSGTLLSNAIRVESGADNFTMDECLVVGSQQNTVTMRLTWGDLPYDVDSHLLTPNNSQIAYFSPGSLTSEPYANLDVDDTSSFGPEVVTIRKLMVGTYKYGVKNYSGTKNPGLSESPIRVELDGATGRRIFTAPAGETDSYSTDFLHLFNLNVDAQCNIEVVPVNAWSYENFNQETTEAPTYCTLAE